MVGIYKSVSKDIILLPLKLHRLNSSDYKVSVVIPVYNSEKFLVQSINSVLNQTYKNIEIIAIDDGSTDASKEILQQYQDKITIIPQKNQGLAKALNVAINRINGKWFKWFSPDDILLPDAIEMLVSTARNLPENTIVYSDWEIINENGERLRYFKETNYNNLSPFEFNVRLLDGQQINVNTTLIPSSLFERGCLIRQLEDPVAIDYDFFLRAGMLYDTLFYHIPLPLLKYRIHENQLSHKNISKSLSYVSKIKNNVLLMLQDSKKEQYLTALLQYEKNKPISKKTMHLGLKVASMFPQNVTDRLIVFYLNKMRRSR